MLQAKTILFICPKFYDYHDKIKGQLENKGAKVYYISDDVRTNTTIKLLCHIGFVKNWIINNRINKLFKILPKEIDYLFAVKGELINNCFKKEFDKTYPLAKKFMYQWDSLNNHDYRDNISYFNKVFSFDYDDVNKNARINYLSLFYCDTFINRLERNKLDYDFSFIGAFHGDRYDFLSKVKKEANRLNLNVYIYLFITKLSYLKLRLKKINKSLDRDILKFTKISKEETAEVMNNSKAILDINSKKQSGLTIRTIETFASQRKLITTNKNIELEPIYNTSKHLILDRERPVLRNDFFHLDSSDITVDNYHLKEWINTIFKEE